MIKLGLDNEELIFCHGFGEVLIAHTGDGVLTPVVTFVTDSLPVKYNSRVLYTVLSTCYDGEVFARYEKPYWLWHIYELMGRVGFQRTYLRNDTHELIAAQAYAFEQIKNLQGGHLHDKHTPSPARLQPPS